MKCTEKRVFLAGVIYCIINLKKKIISGPEIFGFNAWCRKFLGESKNLCVVKSGI